MSGDCFVFRVLWRFRFVWLFGGSGTRSEPALLCSALPSDWVESSGVVGVCVHEEGGGG